MTEDPERKETDAVGGSPLQAVVMRLTALGAICLMLVLFWLPLWFALRETLGVAWRWAKSDVPHEYAKWAGAIGCAAKALITGRKCGA